MGLKILHMSQLTGSNFNAVHNSRVQEQLFSIFLLEIDKIVCPSPPPTTT